MDNNFWAFVALALLIAVSFLVILAKALGAGRRSAQAHLADDHHIVGKRETCTARAPSWLTGSCNS